MKRLCLLTSLGWLLTGIVAFGQNKNSLGLAYELAQIKVESERILQLALLKEPVKADAVTKHMAVETDVVKQYMAVKASFDPILTQLMADLQLRNRLGLYRKLDEAVKSSTNLGNLPGTGSGVAQSYSGALKDAYKKYTDLISTETNEYRVNLVEPSDIISGATLLFDVIKDIRDARTKKVEKIVALLESLRLSPVDGIDKTDNKEPAGKIQAKK